MRLVTGLLLLCLSVGCVSAQTSIGPDANNVFHIVDGSNSQDGWQFNSTTLVRNPTLTMTAGTTYWFSIEQDTRNNHPFGLNTVGSTTTAVIELGLQPNTTTCTGTATSGYQSQGNPNPCTIKFTPTATTPAKIYYHCAFHGNMVGTINVAGGATAAPPTTPAPGSPTPAPTKAPGGSASSLVPGLVVVFAALAGVAVNH